MGNRETLGIVTVLAGVLLVIGAVRGTWRQLFNDVVLGNSSNTPQPQPDAGTGYVNPSGALSPAPPGEHLVPPGPGQRTPYVEPDALAASGFAGSTQAAAQ